MEQRERQKQLEQAAAQPAAQLPAETPATPTIMPPSTGEPVSSTTGPYGLPVAEIDPGYQEALEKEELAAREATNGAGPETTTAITPSESEQAPIHHG